MKAILSGSNIERRINILGEFGYGVYELFFGYAIASSNKSNDFYAEGPLFNILEEAEIFLGID